jgi:MraZ protein
VVKSGKLGMFSGEFGYRIDDKGRVPIPPKFRRELEAGIVLSLGQDGCIVAYPIAEWEKIAAKLNSNGSLEQAKMRRLKRAIFATAFPTSIDGQGRISVPVKLRDYAGIESDVVVVGVNNNLELWSTENWNKELSSDLEQAWQIIESLENR